MLVWIYSMDLKKINAKHKRICRKFLSAGCEWSDLPTNAFTQSLLRMTIEKMQSCLSEEQELEKQIDQIIESIPSTIETIRNWRNILSEILIALFLSKFSPIKPALLGWDIADSSLEKLIHKDGLCKSSVFKIYEHLRSEGSSEKSDIKLRYVESTSSCSSEFFSSPKPPKSLALSTPPPHATDINPSEVNRPIRNSG